MFDTITQMDSTSTCNSSTTSSSSAAAGAGKKRGKSGKSAYKHIPHREKPAHLVARRNARERRRVQAVNSAFSILRKHVPIENRSKRVSKVKTLQKAIEYIISLKSILGEEIEFEAPHPPDSHHVQTAALEDADDEGIESSSSSSPPFDSRYSTSSSLSSSHFSIPSSPASLSSPVFTSSHANPLPISHIKNTIQPEVYSANHSSLEMMSRHHHNLGLNRTQSPGVIMPSSPQINDIHNQHSNMLHSHILPSDSHHHHLQSPYHHPHQNLMEGLGHGSSYSHHPPTHHSQSSSIVYTDLDWMA